MKVENPTTRRIPTQVFALKTDFGAVAIMLLTVLMSDSQSVSESDKEILLTKQIAVRFCYSKQLYLTLDSS